MSSTRLESGREAGWAVHSNWDTVDLCVCVCVGEPMGELDGHALALQRSEVRARV